MRCSYETEHWQKVTVKDIPCLFTDCRIDRETIPEGKIMYEVADECDGTPCRMKPGILVNFFGSIVTDHKFEPDDGENVYLEEDDWCYLD